MFAGPREGGPAQGSVKDPGDVRTFRDRDRCTRGTRDFSSDSPEPASDGRDAFVTLPVSGHPHPKGPPVEAVPVSPVIPFEVLPGGARELHRRRGSHP